MGRNRCRNRRRNGRTREPVYQGILIIDEGGEEGLRTHLYGSGSDERSRYVSDIDNAAISDDVTVLGHKWFVTPVCFARASNTSGVLFENPAQRNTSEVFV